MSCSGVVLTAIASIGLVLVCTISSKMLAPGSHYLIEVLEDNLTHFAPQPRGAVEFGDASLHKVTKAPTNCSGAEIGRDVRPNPQPGFHSSLLVSLGFIDVQSNIV